MSKKVDRALYGPTWTEVIFGAVLSIALGIALAGSYLVFKPVTLVKEIPKEPAAGMVYYIEGSHDGAKARRMAAKQKAFLQGGSIVLIEDEINLALIPASSAPPPKPAADKKPAAPEGETTEFLSAGTPNFRIHDGLLQMSTQVRVKYSLVGLDTTFLVQTQGTFVKDGDAYVYQPTTIYLGSCPVQRVPMLKNLVTKKFLGAQRFPADLVAAWQKLAEVTIEGSTLKLSMPKT